MTKAIVKGISHKKMLQTPPPPFLQARFDATVHVQLCAATASKTYPRALGGPSSLKVACSVWNGCTETLSLFALTLDCIPLVPVHTVDAQNEV